MKSRKEEQKRQFMRMAEPRLWTRLEASSQMYRNPSHQAHIDLFKLESKYDSYTRSDQLCALFEANNDHLRF